MSNSTTPTSSGSPTPPGSLPPGSTSGGAPADFPTQAIDPSGVWARFLSTPGCPATPKNVQMFINGILKSFNVLIQQADTAAQQAAKRMKDAINGK